MLLLLPISSMQASYRLEGGLNTSCCVDWNVRLVLSSQCPTDTNKPELKDFNHKLQDDNWISSQIRHKRQKVILKEVFNTFHSCNSQHICQVALCFCLFLLACETSYTELHYRHSVDTVEQNPFRGVQESLECTVCVFVCLPVGHWWDSLRVCGVNTIVSEAAQL